MNTTKVKAIDVVSAQITQMTFSFNRQYKFMIHKSIVTNITDDIIIIIPIKLNIAHCPLLWSTVSKWLMVVLILCSQTNVLLAH
jgi:hypothetical protein